MKLLHYGLQRSGTNFLKTILEKKYRVRFLNRNKNRSSPLQKHFRLYDNKDIVPEPRYRNEVQISGFEDFERIFKLAPDYYLVISKDPYSWLLSYSKWARKCNWPEPSYHYITEYNLFYGKWMQLSRQTNKIIFVRYIDLLQDVDSELSRLEAALQLRRKLFSFGWKLHSLAKVPQSPRFTEDRRTYYKEEVYLKEYDEEELQAVNKLLNEQVVDFLGYKKR